MAPKTKQSSPGKEQRGHSRAGDAGESPNWRGKILNAKLNDANFRVKVVCLDVAGSEQDRLYLNKFEAFAAEEKRSVVKVICKTETIFMITQLGNETKVKDENNKVFEEAAVFLRTAEDKNIPSEYLALVIKHLIVKLKEEYLFIKRQKLDVAEGCKRESLIMGAPVEVRGTVHQRPAAASAQPKAEKSKPGKDVAPATKPSRSEQNLGDIDEDKKYHTQLRERGEEWRDKDYAEDYPIDGPHLYIVVSGFQDPFLPLSLVRVGVPLVAVVQIRVDVANLRIPSSLTRAAKRGASQTQLMVDESRKFWDDMQQLRIMPATTSYLKDTAFVVFSPPYWETDNLTGDAEKIYDEISFLLYDTHDLARQHQNFLDNMYVIHIPEDVNESKEGRGPFYYYTRLIEGIPLECCSIYSVLDSIVHAVAKLSDGPDSETTDSHVDVKSTKASVASNRDEKEVRAETLVNDIFDNLCQADNDRKTYRVTYGEEFEKFKDPTVISYGDIVKYFTFHLRNIDLEQIVQRMLAGMPVNKLWLKEDGPLGEMEMKISWHVNVLLSCFERTDVETSELVRLLNILACRKLYNNRSSLRKEHNSPETLSDFKKTYLKRTVLAEPITRAPSVVMSTSSASPSFPSIIRSDNLSALSADQDDYETYRVKLLFECPDISELITSAEIAAEEPVSHLMDDYEYFEDFSGTAGLQIIMDSFNKYNCLDYKYCEVTDSIVMMFFNSHDKEGVARDTWRNHVPTAVCLQDFFDYVLDEHYDWIREQDELYYEALALMTRSMYSKHMFEQYEHSCLNETELEMEMMLQGSLKHQQMVALEASTQAASSDDNPSQPSTGAPKVEKKVTPRKSKAKPPKEEIPIQQKFFAGYKLGDRRVEFYGKDSTYFSKDGSKINTMYYLVISTNYEWIIMNMVPGNGNTEFWFQRVIGDYAASPNNTETSDNFRINTRDQVMYNINRVNYRVLLNKAPSAVEEPKVPLPASHSTPKLPTSKPVFESPAADIYGTQFYHTLYVTWPNGLLLETVHDDNSPVLSHIRLTYLSDVPGINEEMRCYTLKGEAIIFRKSGNIEVLCPDGTYFNITKCGQRPAAPTSHDEAGQETNKKARKDKKEEKGKGDKRGKEEKDKKAKDEKLDKTGRSSPRSKGGSSFMINQEEPIEMEFGIEEFEMIDTLGLKQHFYNKRFHKIEKLLIKTATDYCLGEVFMRRTDGTHYLLNKNGAYVSTYPDGTRIISDCFEEEQEVYPEWTDEEKAYFETLGLDMVEVESLGTERSTITDGSTYEPGRSFKRAKPQDDGYISVHIVYTIEHKNYARVTINNYQANVKLDSPNGTSIVVDYNNHYDMRLDEATTAKFDGVDLSISYEACEQCHAFTTCDVKISYDEICSVDEEYRHWLRMKDSYCQRVLVNEEGDITLMDEDSWSYDPTAPPCHEQRGEEETPPAEGGPLADGGGPAQEACKSEGSLNLHGQCRDVYTARTVKFFVLRRDLTCSELVHRGLIEDYCKRCLWHPWCHIDTHDTFGDHRRLLSVLSPVNVTETEKWLMESRLSGKPTRLVYKDLKEDSCEKGFYHWMRPLSGEVLQRPIEPDAVLPPRLPQAFILRTLELQWCEEERAELKGARELVRAILKYRETMATDRQLILRPQVQDPRSREEIDVDRKVQLLGMQLYRKLKERLNVDLRNRIKKDITTRPWPQAEEAAVAGEEDSSDNTEEELRQLDEILPLDENLTRYWKRRAEELKEEEFYRYLLSNDSVPPYFRNVLGGAIWWEVNAAAGDAVTRAERLRSRCECAEDGPLSPASPTPPPSDEDGACEARGGA